MLAWHGLKRIRDSCQLLVLLPRTGRIRTRPTIGAVLKRPGCFTIATGKRPLRAFLANRTQFKTTNRPAPRSQHQHVGVSGRFDQRCAERLKTVL